MVSERKTEKIKEYKLHQPELLSKMLPFFPGCTSKELGNSQPLRPALFVANTRLSITLFFLHQYVLHQTTKSPLTVPTRLVSLCSTDHLQQEDGDPDLMNQKLRPKSIRSSF